MKTSSVRRATSASRSADSYALTNFATIASSEGEAGGGSRSAVGGRRRCRLARARLRALLTDSTVESSMSATSFAWNPSTSRKIRTASWRGGRTTIPLSGRSGSRFNGPVKSRAGDTESGGDLGNGDIGRFQQGADGLYFFRGELGGTAAFATARTRSFETGDRS